MKRFALFALGILGIALLGIAVFSVGGVSGAPRLLIGAGSLILLVGVTDGVRQGATKETGVTSPASAPAANAADSKLADASPAPAAAKPAPTTTSAATVAASAKPETIIDLRDTGTNTTGHIDLREGRTSLVSRSALVDQLINEGLLTVVDGPVSDHDVRVMIMVAVAEGAVPAIRPRLYAIAGERVDQRAKSVEGLPMAAGA